MAIHDPGDLVVLLRGEIQLAIEVVDDPPAQEIRAAAAQRAVKDRVDASPRESDERPGDERHGDQKDGVPARATG
jgi:hypothetical protein